MRLVRELLGLARFGVDLTLGLGFSAAAIALARPTKRRRKLRTWSDVRVRT